VTLLYVPIEHCEHDSIPMDDEYDPCGHAAHTAAELAPNTSLAVPRLHGVAAVSPVLLQ